MRIPLAIISFTPIFGGGEVYCERLARLLREEFEIHSLVASGELQTRLEALGVASRQLGSSGRFSRYSQAKRWVRQFAGSHPAATVILNGPAEATLTGYARTIGLRTVVVRHTDLFLQSSSVKRWLYGRSARNADVVICVSHVVARQHGFVRPERLKVIPHWVTTHDQVHVRTGRFSVVSVGRVEPDKGVWEIVEAAKALREIEFVLVGEGSLRKEVSRVQLPNLLLAGFQAELLRFYERADLLVNASHSEGSSLVVLEAMAAGVPCLVSDIPALREIADDGRVAAMFRTGDAEALAGAIRKLQSDPVALRALRDAGRERVRREHSPEAALQHYRAVLRG